jgi:hypothetical protein
MVWGVGEIYLTVMNQYMIRELEDFLAQAKRGEITSVVIAASMRDGRSLAAWEVHDRDILDSLDFVCKCAEDGVDNSLVLESNHEENHQDRGHQAKVQTLQEDVQPELREARPEAS